MLVPISDQAYIFLCTVLGGLLVGFIYDLFRISRRVIKTHNIIVYFEDIAFWILVSLTSFAIIFVSNSGKIRGYSLIGIVLGVIIYYFLFSYFIMKITINIINFIKKVLILIYKILRIPIIFMYRIIYYPVMFIYRITKKVLKFIQKINKKITEYFKLNIKNIKITLKKY
jgi:spore cortex biosynthesis protein YabQ